MEAHRHALSYNVIRLDSIVPMPLLGSVTGGPSLVSFWGYGLPYLVSRPTFMVSGAPAPIMNVGKPVSS
jgi:hypothetical protein